MDNTALDRAKIALNIKSDKELAEILGINTSSVHGYKTRGGSVPLEQCIKIAQMTGVDLNWLILGVGKTPSGSYIQNTSIDDMPVGIPLYDIAASAGNGSTFSQEKILLNLYFRSDWLHAEGLYQKDLVCLGIKGDSMMPTLKDGDTILVNLAKKTGDGIFVIRIGDQLRIKRLQWLSDGKIKIISDNPIYDTEIIDPVEIDGHFEIIGSCHTRTGLVQ